QLIDGKLNTPEETKTFLEPYSPPAPPPQITIKRSRAKRAEKIKEKSFDDEEDSEDGGEDEEDLDDIGGGGDDDDEILDLKLPKNVELDEELGEQDDGEEEESEDEDEEEKPAPRRGKQPIEPKVVKP